MGVTFLKAVAFVTAKMFTKEDKLPTLEELEVPEVTMGSTWLRAGACHLGKYCEPENNEFVLCKLGTNNPVKCLNEGKAVTSCSMKFFQSVKAFCAAEFTTYARCIETTNRHEIHQCRKTQYAFDNCVKDNMGFDRPFYAYNTLAKIHDTDRPKPEDPWPAWLDDPRGAYGRPDVLPKNFPGQDEKNYKPDWDFIAQSSSN